MPEEVLAIQGLTTVFDVQGRRFAAVDDVSFGLAPGKTLCLVGESGSGKSVTARSILQLVTPPGRIEAGAIRYRRPGLEPVDLAKMPSKGPGMRAIRGREIAMIFQEPMTSLSPVHTIGRQITEILEVHGVAKGAEARRRAVEMLDRVRIADAASRLNAYPFEFSGGMRQRVMIAMALACNPAVLIADEPTTALDVTTQAEILKLMRELQREFGMAMLFITHDMGVVAEIADEVAVMRHGKLVERGPVESVFRSPVHDYTKALLEAVRRLEAPRVTAEPAVAVAPSRAPPSADDTVLNIEGVSLEFGRSRPALFTGKVTPGFAALKNVSLQAWRGETIGIVGESGSGKTTLAKCVLGIHKPHAGRIAVRPRDGGEIEVTGASASRLRAVRKIARFVFQDPFQSLNPRMTVHDIVAEPMREILRFDRRTLRTRVENLLDQVGIPASALDRYPHAFSGGQRQRIGLARALALEPELLVLDEPTSALDVSLRGKVLDLLIELQARLGLTYLFVSHDFAVIRYLCDRIAVMRGGEIVEVGATEQVCINPCEDYTRLLLGSVLTTDLSRRQNRGIAPADPSQQRLTA